MRALPSICNQASVCVGERRTQVCMGIAMEATFNNQTLWPVVTETMPFLAPALNTCARIRPTLEVRVHIHSRETLTMFSSTCTQSTALPGLTLSGETETRVTK